MKIKESALYLYCREGRYGAQIPTVELWLGPMPAGADTQGLVEIPDDWVYRTDSQGLPTTRKDSYLFWSRKGLAENEIRLRAEFKTAEHFRAGQAYDYGLSFEDWMKLCLDHCERTEALVTKRVKLLRSKLALYEGFVS
jgi:hypothetical protein